jgi:ABC-type nitrate/sulfonate/bicarbonate transport system substrate-binding protein
MVGKKRRRTLYDQIGIRRSPTDRLFLPISLQAQHTKPVHVSLPGPGNVQHLAYYVAKEKKFYEEMGLANVNIVVLRGNAMNVQALLSGSVHYSSAFGPSMHAMFKGEQIRVLLQIFNQIPFGLITRPEPNFKPEQFIDDRFYKAALKTLAHEPGAKS